MSANTRVMRLSRVLLLAGLIAIPAHAGEFQDDLTARRARVMERLGPESLMILWSAPVRVYSHDVNYEFRQDSDFYYLTGIDQPGSILVLMPGNAQRKEILFVYSRNPLREHWEGRRLSPEEAMTQSGIQRVYTTGEFDTFIEQIFSGRPYGVPAASAEFEAFHNALADSRAKLQLLLGVGTGVPDEPNSPFQFGEGLKERFVGFTVENVAPVIHSLRQFKTPYEQEVLEESANVSVEAHMAGMRAARPGVYEYEVEAAIEYVFKRNGAFDWSYPPVVGSGPNATVLHYSKSSREMEAGEVLLVDAAAHYKYLTVDITRTYPVSGTFSDAQKDIYNLVLRALEEGIKAAKPGATFREIHLATANVIKEGLFRLGLITDTAGDQYRLWYTHSATHWIGMDVHDVGNRDRPLAPGMAFVVEPGLYIRRAALDNLPDTPQNAALIEKVRPAVEKYADIGVRIEDSFLLTESELKNLSVQVPRTVEEIETFMTTR